MPPDSRASAAPVRIALIGLGYWGPNYARVLSDLPNVELTAICDQRADRLSVVRRRHGTVAICSTLDELLAREDVDAIVIATPASTHEALVRASLASGRHVLVEKPMALHAAGCHAMCDLAESAGLVLMVGYTFLYNAGVRKMKEVMAPEHFGQPYYLHATRTNLGPIRPDVNAAWDLAPHDIAIFNYLLDDQPLWASAIGTSVLKTSREDIAFATLGFKNDVIGNIHVSWADPNKVREVVAVGSRRRVVFDDLNNVERVRVFERGVSVGEAVSDSFGEFKLLVRDGDIISPKVDTSEPLKNQCADFVNAILTGTPAVAGGRFGTGVVRTLVAIDTSMRSRGVAVDV